MSVKRYFLIVSASIFVIAGSFFGLEPIVSPAQAVTDNIAVSQAVTSGISISNCADITLTALSTSQNTAVGSSSCTVTTNNVNGYSLTVFASSAPALSPAGISDYTPAVAETPETWSVSSAAEFGYSARGTNVNTSTYGTDTDCLGAGADLVSTTLKFRDFDLTGSADQIATTASPTTTSGATSVLCVATEQNGIFAPSGSYSATITATATAL